VLPAAGEKLQRSYGRRWRKEFGGKDATGAPGSDIGIRQSVTKDDRIHSQGNTDIVIVIVIVAFRDAVVLACVFVHGGVVGAAAITELVPVRSTNDATIRQRARAFLVVAAAGPERD
jgi:hypothetical protein